MTKSSKDSAPSAQTWDIVIQSTTRFDWGQLKEIIQYRDLVFLFVRRDFVAQYKQTVLGPAWYIIQPLLTTVVFTIVFGNVAKISTDGLPKPLFYLAGLTVWNFFQMTLVEISNVFIKNAPLFSKVFFPRLIVPIATMFSRYISLAIQICLFLGFFIYYFCTVPGIRPNMYLLFVPLFLIQASLLALACGMIISAVTVKYRDLAQLVQFGVQLWMYATPIVYPISQIPDKWQWVLAVNPMAYSVDLFKYAFTGVGEHNLFYFAISCLVSLVLLMLGTASFSKAGKTFVDKV